MWVKGCYSYANQMCLRFLFVCLFVTTTRIHVYAQCTYVVIKRLLYAKKNTFPIFSYVLSLSFSLSKYIVHTSASTVQVCRFSVENSHPILTTFASSFILSSRTFPKLHTIVAFIRCVYIPYLFHEEYISWMLLLADWLTDFPQPGTYYLVSTLLDLILWLVYKYAVLMMIFFFYVEYVQWKLYNI